jgi:hypothetical protein
VRAALLLPTMNQRQRASRLRIHIGLKSLSYSATELSGTNLEQKNESEFREYGKFEASSSVDFGTGK